MPIKYKILIVFSTVLLLVITTAAITWQIQSWRYSSELANLTSGYEKKLSEINRISNEQLVVQQQKNNELQIKLTAIEKTQYQELINEKAKNDQLIDDLFTARKRLSITATSCTTNSSGLSKVSNASRLGNATATAYLDSRTATALIRITRRGDEAIRQLSTCQQYIKH